MRRKELQIIVREYEAVVELPEEDQCLLLKAREAAGSAYAPYSGFHVGAAVLLENGEVIQGSNQENVDLTDGLCAERVALFYAHSKYPEVPVKAIAVSARDRKGITEEPAYPCGSCRQVLVETQTRYQSGMHIILDGIKNIQVFESADCLLPFAFKPDLLD